MIQKQAKKAGLPTDCNIKQKRAGFWATTFKVNFCPPHAKGRGGGRVHRKKLRLASRGGKGEGFHGRKARLRDIPETHTAEYNLQVLLVIIAYTPPQANKLRISHLIGWNVDHKLIVEINQSFHPCVSLSFVFEETVLKSDSVSSRAPLLFLSQLKLPWKHLWSECSDTTMQYYFFSI